MFASAATMKINPSQPVHLGAGTYPQELASRVVEDIEANIVRLKSDDVEVLLVSLDLLYPGWDIRRAISEAAPDLDAPHILVGASHTHRAPMTDSSKPRLGQPTAHYLNQLTTGLQTLVENIREPSNPVALRVGAGQAHHSINRRQRKRIFVAKKPLFNEVINAPNPYGPTDEVVTVLVGTGNSAEPEFVLWNYACHPVGFPEDRCIASHYPEGVRSYLRSQYGKPDLPVLFLQGFSGDTRPAPTAIPWTREAKLRRLINGNVFSDMSWLSYRKWSMSLALLVMQLSQAATKIDGEGLVVHRQEFDIDRFVAGAADSRKVSFQSVVIGKTLTIAAASAEVVCEYAPWVRGLSNTPETMCVGCIDDPFGYAPTAKMMQEGGYEAGGYCDAFGLTGLNPNVEDAMKLGFRSVLAG